MTPHGTTRPHDQRCDDTGDICGDCTERLAHLTCPHVWQAGPTHDTKACTLCRLLRRRG